MKKSTLAILEEIRRERDRRAALMRQDLERSYQALQESGYDLGLCISVAADLAGSRQIEYHYELVVEDWKRERLVPYLIRYAKLSAPERRREAIIALGWVYAPSQLPAELDCLCGHLLHDDDALCRAWSASAMMQLYFHGAPVEPIRERSLPVFRQSLQQESDDFAAGVAVDSVRELWNLKIRLSGAAVERRDHEMIEKARKRAQRLLAQL